MDDQIIYYSVVNRVRCFLHIVNLIAKAMLKQFDACKRKNGGEVIDDELEAALKELAADMDNEERVTQAFGNGVNDDDEDDDNVTDVEVDDAIQMTAEELAEFQTELRPVMLVLAKVSEIQAIQGDKLLTVVPHSSESYRSRSSTRQLTCCPSGTPSWKNWIWRSDESRATSPHVGIRRSI